MNLSKDKIIEIKDKKIIDLEKELNNLKSELYILKQEGVDPSARSVKHLKEKKPEGK